MKIITDLKQLQKFLGKTVPVCVHLQSHMGKYQDMIYVGEFNFASSSEELLDGRRVLRGLQGFSNQLGELEGKITLYNQNVPSPSDVPARLNFRNGGYETALKLWDARKKE